MPYRTSPFTDRQLMSRSINHSPYSRGNDYSSTYNGSRKRSPVNYPEDRSITEGRSSRDRTRVNTHRSFDYADEPNGGPGPDGRSYSRRSFDGRDKYHSSPPRTYNNLDRPSSSRRRDRPEQRIRESSPPEPSRVLGVFGLSVRTEERDLYDIMKKFGNIEDIQVVYDNLSGRSRGFGFVYFETVEEARAARAACARGLELHDRIVRIDYSKTKKPHEPTPGIYMGKDKRRPSRFQSGGNRYMAPRPRSRSPLYSNRRPRSNSSPMSPPRGRRLSPESSSKGYPGVRRSRQRIQSSSRSRSPPQIYSPKRPDRYQHLAPPPMDPVSQQYHHHERPVKSMGGSGGSYGSQYGQR